MEDSASEGWALETFELIRFILIVLLSEFLNERLSSLVSWEVDYFADEVVREEDFCVKREFCNR